MRHWRLKPTVVEAELLTVNNAGELADWCGGTLQLKPDPFAQDRESTYVTIKVVGLRGWMVVQEGQYLVKLENGKYDTRTKREFEHSYEPMIRYDTPEQVSDTHAWKSEPEGYVTPPQSDNLFDLPRTSFE